MYLNDKTQQDATSYSGRWRRNSKRLSPASAIIALIYALQSTLCNRLVPPANCVKVSCSWSIKIKQMENASKVSPEAKKPEVILYCPVCAIEVSDPLTCGDCSSVICRRCGTPLENSDELAMG